MIEALDVSHWTGHVTQMQWERAREQLGVTLAIVGSWHGSKQNHAAESSLQTARAAGLMTATYIVLSSHLKGSSAVAHGMSACGDEWAHLRFAALDVELDGIKEAHIDGAHRSLGKLPGMMYTGRWFWASNKHLGNPQWGRGLPLWDSHYDGRAHLDANFRPYGPWPRQTAKQYTDHAPNINADRSVFRADWEPLT